MPVGGVLEGGYALGALARSVAATLEALGAPPGSGSGGPWPREVMAAQERLSEWWPNLDPRA